jgi:hypothetical protein
MSEQSKIQNGSLIPPNVLARSERFAAGTIRISQAQNDAHAIFQVFHKYIWQASDLLAERLVGYSDQLAEEQVAIAGDAALTFFEVKPKNSGVFY